MKKILIDHLFGLELKAREKETHKGNYGKVLIVAGSRSMAGAAALASLAAYRTGSGIVKILTEEGNSAPLFSYVPEAIVPTFKRDLSQFDVEKSCITDEIRWADVILIGPGMGTDDYAVKLFEHVLNTAHIPLVIDADGLNILSKNMDLIKSYDAPIIITPHIGEMCRLINRNESEVLENREALAILFSKEHQVTTVLKSERTTVAAQDSIYINKLGNPGMATAGSGDVLSGIIVSLLGQGYTAEQSATFGVYIHSKAGDLAKEIYGEHSMMARDMIGAIHTAILTSTA
jgi:NAD(P)H-hydrate epimerase